jgi:hypothetical protein
MRFAIGICLLCLGFAWFPAVSAAADPVLQVVGQNVAVAYHPPQASAEALLNLPSVYVLPGSFLYWLKHLYEQLRLVFTSDPHQRSALLLQFSQQRLAESYQAMKNQDWPSTIKVLEDYQQNQQQLSGLISSLQARHLPVDDLLNQLKTQLGAQQALDDFAHQHAPVAQDKRVGALLEIRSNQTLALAAAENGALLGAHVDRVTPQSTTSATQGSRSAQTK